MTSRRARTTGLIVGTALLVVALAAYFLTRGTESLPEPGSNTYEQVTRTFYRGLAALQVGLLDGAENDFTRATELVPDEPAGWANLGLTRLRLGELDDAAAPVERAADLAPQNSAIAFLQGQVATARGHVDEGIAHLRRATALDPDALRPRFALAEQIERAAGPDADAEAQRVIEDLLPLAGSNLVVLLERTRLAAKRGDAAVLQDSVRRLEPYAAAWPASVREQFAGLQQAAAASDTPAAARAVLLLRNVLLRVPAFLENLAQVRTAAELFAEPFDRFLRLAPARAMPSPADTAIAFGEQPLAATGDAPVDALLAFSLDGTDRIAIVAADSREVRRLDAAGDRHVFPGGPSAAPPSGAALLALDWNHDFRSDLVFAGRGGVRLLLQDERTQFVESARYEVDAFGAWAADVEMDGDLDIVIGATEGAPIVLRNNGDGTWNPIETFAGVSRARGFAWADIDRDGDPDAAILDAAGAVHVLVNRQAGDFQPAAPPDGLGRTVAMTIGDIDADGLFDIVTLADDGAVRRAAYRSERWDGQVVGRLSSAPGAGPLGSHRLWLADLDNNGAVDVIASGPSGSAVWLAGEELELQPLSAAPAAEVTGIAHLDQDGRLDLVGVAAGRPVRLLGRGALDYHWAIIRPRAQQNAGDQRINAFGLGGDVEIRSGLLVQKQTLTGGPVHFGLGDHTAVDVARIVWPNGVPQAEFDVPPDSQLVAEQRLKGSCPWVFTYDGTAMRFVTDFLWRSPLGLRINAQDTAGVAQTEDWIKIRGDQLAPRDGIYDIRITAELWETHFIDYAALLAVDHPPGTDVYVDERFAPQAPGLAVRLTRARTPIARAWDHARRDVTDIVAREDGRYLAAFTRGRYQGVAQEHFVEFDIEGDVPADRPFWLLAHGWIYPTDSSINVAIGQGSDVRPRGLSLEMRDGRGRWATLAPDLGFPAGKNKTILVDLTRVLTAGGPAPRLRLRTNLEISWDWIATAPGLPDSDLRVTRLQPAAAALRYRGFSASDHVRDNVPETPAYDRLESVAPRWRDLIGYYTRFGDVQELVGGVDDRYVIMNAGDELQLRFTALPPPAAGWTRDYVLIGDGWNKDGDYNTSYSKTVVPLPSHDRPDYGAWPPVELEDDPVYQRHANDWRTYHTRYVTPRVFLDGLRAY